MENDDREQIEIREHEIENILGRTPGVLLRIGITVILLVFIVILIGSSFFSYPDMITAKVVVTGEIEPIPLISKSGGKIDRLPVGDNQRIEAGTVIAVMENAANIDDMLYLENRLAQAAGDSVEMQKDELSLGEVQSAYTTWKYAMIAYKNFQKLQYHQKSIEGLKEQLAYLREYITHSEQQNSYLKEQLKLEEKKFQSDEFLASRQVIAGADLDKAKVELLQMRSSAEANLAAMADSRGRMVQLQQTMLDLQLDYEKQCKTLEDQIRHSREILNGEIRQWEQNYVVRAPKDGRLVYNRYWVSGEFVTPGETMFTLLLQDNTAFEGRIELPMTKSGKVRVGQKVHIKLDNYPYMEYGILKGAVKHISPVANKDLYRVDVELPDGLVGSYHKELPFLQGMSGTADIITEEQTMLQRLLFPLKSLMNNHSEEK